MKKYIGVIIIVLLVIDLGLMAWAGNGYVKANKSVTELEILVNDLEQRQAEETIYSLVTDPGVYFDIISEHPEWEEIDAVPYSKCYRHLIGTTTYDSIVCMAI